MTAEAIVYKDEGVTSYTDLAEAKAARGTTWVRATDADEADFEQIADIFDLHPLSIEDVRSDARPKVEEFEDHTFVLVKTAVLARGETTFAEELIATQVGLFMGEDWVLTISPGTVSAIDFVWEKVLAEERRLLGRGSDFTAYRVFDRIVDDYFDILDELEDDIERVEDIVIEDPTVETLQQINDLRRDLLSVRRLLWPTREVAGVLARGDPEEIAEETEKYYRDVYDHAVQLVELTETYRDLTVGARDVYLNALSVSTNEAMQKLTVVATIVLPLTFVVGIYGMNFEGGLLAMPELGWTYGYPAVMIGMAAVAVVLVWYFRRENWL